MDWNNVDSGALLDLINRLRSQDFKIGTQHYLSAHELVVRLSATKIALMSPDRLRSLLAPLFCSSAREQEDFYSIYDVWAEDWRAPAPKEVDRSHMPPVSVVKPNPKIEQREREILHARSRMKRLSWSILGVALVALVALVASIRVPQKVTIQVPSKSPGDQTSSQPTENETPPSETAAAKEHDKKPNQNDGAQSKVTGQTREIWQIPSHLDVPSWLVPPLIILLLIFIGILIWLSYLNHQIHEVLVRKASDFEPEVRKVLLGRQSTLHSKSDLDLIARSFRRWVAIPSSALDIAQTVRQTVKLGGRFSPAFGTRQSRPAYLFLIQKSSPDDQAAKFIGRVIDDLKYQSVLADYLFFADDPRTCLPPVPSDSPVTLREVAYRFANARLVVFASADTFFDRWTGDLKPWVETLKSWNECVVLAAEGALHSDPLHDRLQQVFSVLPATMEGFAALTDLLLYGRPFSNSQDSLNLPLPQELIARPRYWIDRASPDVGSVDRMIAALRASLGEVAFYWLSACAVFPMMHINLTLYLGENLSYKPPGETGGGHSLSDEHLFLRLALLPWFRYGYMPDWLRCRLLAELTPEHEQQTREVLNHLVDEAEEMPAGANESVGVEIEIAGDPDTSNQAAEVLGQNTAINATPSRGQPKKRDFVFHTFMSEQSIDGLTLKLNRGLFASTPHLTPLPTVSLVDDNADRSVQQLPLSLATLGFIALSGAHSNGLEIYIGLQEICGIGGLSIPFAVLFYTLVLRRFWTSLVASTGCAVAVYYLNKFLALEGDARSLPTIGLVYFAACYLTNYFLNNRDTRCVSRLFAVRIARAILLLHLVAAASLGLVLSIENHIPFLIDPYIQAVLLITIVVATECEIAMGLGLRSSILLRLPTLFFAGVLSLNSSMHLPQGPSLLYRTASAILALTWFVYAVIAIRNNGGVTSDISEIEPRPTNLTNLILHMGTFLALAGVAFQLTNHNPIRNQIGESLTTFARCVLAGISGVAIILGLFLRRFRLTTVGVVGAIGMLVTLRSTELSPLTWWSAQGVAELDRFNVFLAVFCCLPLASRATSQTVGQNLTVKACRMLLRYTFAAQAVVTPVLAVLAAILLTQNDRQSSMLVWILAILLILASTAVTLEMVLSCLLKSPTLLLISIGPVLSASLLWSRTEEIMWPPGRVLSQVFPALIWPVAGLFLNSPFWRRTFLGFKVALQSSDPDTRRRMQDRKVQLRDALICLTAIASAVWVCEIILVDAPDWINPLLRNWQERGVLNPGAPSPSGGERNNVPHPAADKADGSESSNQSEKHNAEQNPAQESSTPTASERKAERETGTYLIENGLHIVRPTTPPAPLGVDSIPDLSSGTRVTFVRDGFGLLAKDIRAISEKSDEGPHESKK